MTLAQALPRTNSAWRTLADLHQRATLLPITDPELERLGLCDQAGLTPRGESLATHLERLAGTLAIPERDAPDALNELLAEINPLLLARAGQVQAADITEPLLRHRLARVTPPRATLRGLAVLNILEGLARSLEVYLA